MHLVGWSNQSRSPVRAFVAVQEEESGVIFVFNSVQVTAVFCEGSSLCVTARVYGESRAREKKKV